MGFVYLGPIDGHNQKTLERVLQRAKDLKRPCLVHVKTVKGQGYTFPVFYDTAMNASSTYGATSLPMTFFIDAEGYGIARAVGAIDSATLQQGIDMILQ